MYLKYFTNVFKFLQIVQALSLKLQTEHFRTQRSFLTDDERGNTMGTLYWHMNDVWVAPSLSSIGKCFSIELADFE